MPFDQLKRREFITLLGGAAAIWPLSARAQQPKPVVGFLNGASSSEFNFLADAFRQGLAKMGFVEGQNLAIEYRWANFQADRMPQLAAELVQRRVALVAATGGAGDNVSLVKSVAPSIPVVFLTGNDPVKLGLVSSLNRPEGNITGVSFVVTALGAKRLELLRELVPTDTLVSVLVNPHFPGSTELQDLQAAGVKLGRRIRVLNASTEAEIDAAFAMLADHRTSALVISAVPFFVARREQIVRLAERYAVPTIYGLREYPALGGLMSYGPSISDAYRQVGLYAGRILKGEKAADLPVIQPTKFELVINLKTAMSLGLTVPLTLQVAADEVIE
jgi:putative ABC transport system substrate-binding protein